MKLISHFSNNFKSILFNLNKKEIETRFENLHNSHLGEECYIFGDGVSIKYFDLSIFQDKISIVSNNFIFHKDYKKLNVKYYSIYEPYWFLPIFVSGSGESKILRNLIQKAQIKKFKASSKTIFFTDISNALGLRGKLIFYIEKNYFKKYIPFGNKLDLFQGSLRLQIAIALFLGFKKAHLIGHDYTHKNSYNSHFYEKGEGTKNNLKSWNKDFLDLASNYIDLTTVTLKGSSDTLKSITYEEFTNQIPVFKENDKLVGKQNLKILSSWPGYNI